MKRLALDVGDARIGVAASDETGSIAFAREVLVRNGSRRDLQALVRLVERERPGELVVGLPVRLDGSEGDRAAGARRFAARAGQATGLPVVLWDERMSTREGAEALRELGLDARRQRPRIDAEAARVILQRYLDHVNAGRA